MTINSNNNGVKTTYSFTCESSFDITDIGTMSSCAIDEECRYLGIEGERSATYGSWVCGAVNGTMSH